MPTFKEDWKLIAADAPTFTPEMLSQRARTFDRKIRGRNLREYAASGMVVAFFGWRMWNGAHLVDQIAAGLIILAAIWTAIRIRSAGTPIEPDAAAPADIQRRQWRDELDRQRRLLMSVRWTYIAPFVPGFLLFALAPLLSAPVDTGDMIVAAVTLAVFAFVLVFVDRLNRKAAAELGDTIAALD